MRTSRFSKVLVALSIAILATTAVALAAQTDIVGPAGSGLFGKSVSVLPNGNLVVTDPGYDAPGPITNTGAVYLYDGGTGALISRLTGSQANDQVGSGGVVTLTNGNYVVLSTWSNGATVGVGAATWSNGTTGITGTIFITNSLVGSHIGDLVGYYGATALSNGNYVVLSPAWDNGAASDAGAATWGNGTTGITGTVSLTNSLVGTTANDRVGYKVTTLTNRNYVVISPFWANGVVTQTGAVTWGNGTMGITGTVSVANSLVGTTTNDKVGYEGVTVLTNGNYVVRSPTWDNGAVTDAGAATWGNGTTGIAGTISAANSLVGSTVGDQVSAYATALSNGNYVVDSRYWDNGAVVDVGAATWGNGTTGITGTVSTANSLVGSLANDQVGYLAVALSNGNYVVLSPLWANGLAAQVGAATWGNGVTGITGAVTTTNSLVGSNAADWVGYWAIALSNGNYVVLSPFWNNGAVADVGAATWGNGTMGITGTVSGANSLVGTTITDYVGVFGVTALSDGNYVVLSTMWDNGTAANAGAVTLGNGRSGTVGPITNNNSVLGTAAEGGSGLNWGYNPLRGQLVVGRPADNRVTLFGPHHVYLPLVIKP